MRVRDYDTIRNMNTSSKKIFLTGERDVGKTTIIERFTGKLDFVPAGFNTLSGRASADGSIDHIFIIPFGTSLKDMPDALPVATRRKESLESPSNKGLSSTSPFTTHDKIKWRYESYPEIFDSLGAEILKRTKGAKLIIMDELGFMENEALAFQAEVLACLDGDAPVLGVIKPTHTPFLDKIRAHSAVQILEVTTENRIRILNSLIENFKDAI